MTSIDYDDIFGYFLGYVHDCQLAAMSMNDAYAEMREWLHKAYSQPYINRLFKNAEMDDDLDEFTFDMAYSVKGADDDFVVEVLATGMMIEWLKPQVRSKVNLSQYFGGKEGKFYSQANHIDQLRNTLEDAQIELKRIIRDRGFIHNDYLGGQ